MLPNQLTLEIDNLAESASLPLYIEEAVRRLVQRAYDDGMADGRGIEQEIQNW